MSLIKSAAPVETIVGQCQSCQRQLQRKSEIVDCKNGGHKACSFCTQNNQGTCNNCTVIASTKFQQEYLEKLNLPQLRQIMKALGMGAKNDLFQTQTIVDAILEFKNNPASAKAKAAPKANLPKGPKVLIINKPSTIIITETSGPKAEAAKRTTPTTPKSPGLLASWPPNSPSATSNGTRETNGTSSPIPSPRKTSVNVGDYYQRQSSNKSPDIDAPKGSVSQLRATFENATNATYKPPAAATSPTRKLPQTQLFEETKTEEKIEDAVTEAVDQSDSYDEPTSASEEYHQTEEEHEEPEPEPEVDAEDYQNDSEVVENHDSHEDETGREEEREEEEEERREEVAEDEHSEENHLQEDHRQEEISHDEDVAPDYEEAASEDLAAAEQEIEEEKEKEEEELAEQVREIIDEATAVLEDE